MGMRIGILGNDLGQPHMRGLPRYAVGLIGALAEAGIEVVVLSREPVASVHRGLQVRYVNWWGSRELLWEQYGVPRMASRLGVDVIHAPSNRGLCAFASCPTVLTRHDAIERMFPPDFPGTRRSRFRMWYSDEISIRCATCVVTVSERSRMDILSIWNLSPERVIAAGEGIEEFFFEPPSSRARKETMDQFGIRRSYILYVGGLDKRKEVPTLVEAFDMTGGKHRQLVIAGPTRGELAAVKASIERHRLDGRVLLLGEVADRHLHGLYAGADCFVYPSRYEGFGLQAAEALAMRVPLIISDGGALPEIAGGHALQFPVGDAAKLAERMTECFEDSAGRERRVAAGATYAERFKWSNVISAYLELYRSLGARRLIC